MARGLLNMRRICLLCSRSTSWWWQFGCGLCTAEEIREGVGSFDSRLMSWNSGSSLHCPKLRSPPYSWPSISSLPCIVHTPQTSDSDPKRHRSTLFRPSVPPPNNNFCCPMILPVPRPITRLWLTRGDYPILKIQCETTKTTYIICQYYIPNSRAMSVHLIPRLVWKPLIFLKAHIAFNSTAACHMSFQEAVIGTPRIDMSFISHFPSSARLLLGYRGMQCRKELLTWRNYMR